MIADVVVDTIVSCDYFRGTTPARWP